MYLWTNRLIDGIVVGFQSALNQLTDGIWLKMLQWFYDMIYSAVADFFSMMGNMGADVFDLKWVQGIFFQKSLKRTTALTR